MKIASGVAIAVLMTAFQPELDKQRDEAIRTFQDSPCLGRFSEAGIAIMNASDWANARDRKEDDLPPAHPEFEKMKARLATGVMVSMSAIQPPSEWDVPEGDTMASLPAIRPSFFRADDALFAIAVRPFKIVDKDVVPLIDALSAINRLTMRIRTAGPIGFGTGGSPNGSWDVASVEARFDQEALVHGLTRDGRSTGYRVRSVMAPIGERNCTDRSGSIIGTRVTPDWDSSIVAWIGKPAPGTAMVTSRQTGSGVTKRVTETVDFDRDGVPDFFISAGSDIGISDLPVPWKIVFVNVEGKWRIGSYRSAPDCT